MARRPSLDRGSLACRVAVYRQELLRAGIDPQSITSHEQLDAIVIEQLQDKIDADIDRLPPTHPIRQVRDAMRGDEPTMGTEPMDQVVAAETLLRELKNYAAVRRRDVARGLETPELAGLIVQKYGYGLVDAFWSVYERNGGPGPTYNDVDGAVAAIDPQWQDTWARRRQSKAALDLSAPRT